MEIHLQEISAAIKVKKNPKDIIDGMKPISQKIADFEIKVEELSQKIDKIKYIIPNIPDKSIPVGGPANSRFFGEAIGSIMPAALIPGRPASTLP